MVEPILIAALCGVFFMFGRCYEDFLDMFAEAEVWEHPETGAWFITYR